MYFGKVNPCRFITILEDYTRRNGKITQIDLKFEYINSSSTRCIAAMLIALEKDKLVLPLL
jgi:hypothetical protein